MKRIALVAALLGAFILAFAGIASAADPITTPGSSSTPNVNSKGTAVFHYTANYVDPFYGSVSCSGVRQIKAKQPMQDSFTCTSTTGSQIGTPGAAVSAPYGWYSDYDGIYTTSLSATFSADGTSYTGVATY
jgi:hypothetical protein